MSDIPKVMYKDGQKIDKDNIASAFAQFFNEKIQNIVNETEINPDVYNGKSKDMTASHNVS